MILCWYQASLFKANVLYDSHSLKKWENNLMKKKQNTVYLNNTTKSTSINSLFLFY